MCAIAMSQERKEYTPQEVARILKVDQLTVKRRIYAGKIRARKEGRFWRIGEDDLQAYIEQTYREGSQGPA